MNILVSSCLLGIKCRYDGKDNLKEKLLEYLRHYNLIPVCPEQLGGLPTPRPPAEIFGKNVVTKDGIIVMENYIKGATEVLHIAKLYGIKLAILKERSPSCGYGKIYDGSFSHTLTDGNGVCADLLYKNGIKIIGESYIDDFFNGFSKI